jgi:dTDP-4-amino-4,6-dideoxygalactose transaminase
MASIPPKSADVPALEGGTPVRREPLPTRKPFGPEELKEVQEALASGNLFYASGTKVYGFLEEFRRAFGVQGVVPSTSGTAAIHVAIGALNLEPGDEVLVPPVTDMGSVAPIILSGAVPVFVDVDPATFNLDPSDLARKITPRTRAVLVVHCWGRPADLDAIRAVLHGRGIALIEDCAQAHYVRYQGRLCGTIGDLGTFSFQQSKHITCGDGGATIVNRPELLPRAELFVDKGCDWTQDRVYRKTYAFIAPCYRMTELQGAVLLAQVRKLPAIVAGRRDRGARLVGLLAGTPGVALPPAPDETFDHGYWGFPLRVDEEALGIGRDKFREALLAEGIRTDVWIGKPLYLYDALQKHITFGTSRWPFSAKGRRVETFHEGLCPNAESAMRRLVNVVRVHEQTTDEDLQSAARAIRKVATWYAGRSK